MAYGAIIGTIVGAIGNVVGGVQQGKNLEKQSLQQQSPQYINHFGQYQPPQKKNYTPYFLVAIGAILLALIVFRPKK